MKILITFLFLAVILVASFLKPPPARAEVATTHDWIGLFSTAAGNRKADTVNSNSWVYTSSCTQIAGSTPKLVDPTGCTIYPNPTPLPGTYQLRMYANDSEDLSGLIAVSKTITGAAPTPGPGVHCPIQSSYPRVSGLISAANISNNFGNSAGTCVVDPQKAPFISYKIPTYDDLKSLYYTQAKATACAAPPCKTSIGTADPITSAVANNLYNYTAPLGLSIGSGFSYPSNGAAVVFVDGDLTVMGNITGNPDGGLVVVVNGKISISPSVTQIDAVLISAKTIYTAGDGCSLNPAFSNPLVINGSLISINQNSANPIAFCRQLTDNRNPAEKMVNQPKYLVILRNLLSDTYQKWSEIQ